MYSVRSAQIQFCLCYKAFELYNCPKSFVPDGRLILYFRSPLALIIHEETKETENQSR